MKHLGIFSDSNAVQSAIDSNELVKPYIVLTGQSGSRLVDYNTLEKVPSNYIKILKDSGDNCTIDEIGSDFSTSDLSNNPPILYVNDTETNIYSWYFENSDLIADITGGGYGYKFTNNMTEVSYLLIWK